MPRLLAIGTAAAVAATALALVAPQAADAKAVSTKYTLQGSGSGLLVVGGSLPAASGKTNQVSSGCTDKAPTSAQNSTAKVSLPSSLGSIGAMTSRTWTSQSGATVNRYTQSKIGDVKVGNALGSLDIEGLTVTAHVWHNKSGFHAQNSASAVSVATKLAGLPLPGGNKLPTPSTPITIPGLLSLSFSTPTTKVGAHTATAKEVGFTLDLLATGTKLRLGAAWAQMSDGVRSGIFSGNAAATHVSLLGATVTSDGQPEVYMPCSGTNNKTQIAALASVPLGSVGAPLTASGATSSQIAVQTAKRASGHERSYIGRVNLGNGALVVNALTAQANVTRSGKSLNTVTATANGTTAGSVTVNGKTYTLSQLNTLDTTKIPGLSNVLSVKAGVKTLIKSGGKTIGIAVVGLRVTLLDATSQTKSTIDLATARFRIVRP